MSGMCPHCGQEVTVTYGLTVVHGDGNDFVCRGSEQNPRCAESDGRVPWNGKPNERFLG